MYKHEDFSFLVNWADGSYHFNFIQNYWNKIILSHLENNVRNQTSNCVIENIIF